MQKTNITIEITNFKLAEIRKTFVEISDRINFGFSNGEFSKDDMKVTFEMAEVKTENIELIQPYFQEIEVVPRVEEINGKTCLVYASNINHLIP